MKIIFLVFMFFYALHRGIGMDFQYFSNFKFEEIVFGQEHLVKDYLTLANDPNGNLPDSYTVCSSILVDFVTSDKVFIQMLKQNGTPWYLIDFGAARIYDTQAEALNIWYDNPLSGKNELESLSKTHIPIVPHSWYHICMGLDTVYVRAAQDCAQWYSCDQ